MESNDLHNGPEGCKVLCEAESTVWARLKDIREEDASMGSWPIWSSTNFSRCGQIYINGVDHVPWCFNFEPHLVFSATSAFALASRAIFPHGQSLLSRFRVSANLCDLVLLGDHPLQAGSSRQSMARCSHGAQALQDPDSSDRHRAVSRYVCRS